jgi:hypothetical protein
MEAAAAAKDETSLLAFFVCKISVLLISHNSLARASIVVGSIIIN